MDIKFWKRRAVIAQQLHENRLLIRTRNLGVFEQLQHPTYDDQLDYEASLIQLIENAFEAGKAYGLEHADELIIVDDYESEGLFFVADKRLEEKVASQLPTATVKKFNWRKS